MRCTAFAFGLGLSVLPAQVQVGATGTVQVTYQPSSGGVVSQSRAVVGATSLSLSGVGSAVVTTGITSEMMLTALSPPGPCWGCWSQASGDVVFEFGAASPVAGVLRLALTPACIMVVPPMIDVNADGSTELVGALLTQTLDVPVVLGAEPVLVRVTGNTVNFGGATCAYPLHVEFVPAASALATVGVPCGPSLAAALTDAGSRHLTLRFGGMAGQIGAIFVGGPPLPQPLPCAATTTPAAALILVPNPNGAELVIPLSAAIVGVYTLQYVELMANGQLQWSNGVAATL